MFFLNAEMLCELIIFLTFPDAAKIASQLMLQEEWSDPISRALALYSCYAYIENPAPEPWREPDPVEDPKAETVSGQSVQWIGGCHLSGIVFSVLICSASGLGMLGLWQYCMSSDEKKNICDRVLGAKVNVFLVSPNQKCISSHC